MTDEILRILEAIRDLANESESTSSWVKWRAVAKRSWGSDEYVELAKSYAETPEYGHLFRTAKGNVVTLSEAGIELLGSVGNSCTVVQQNDEYFLDKHAPESNELEMVEIGRCVRSYASRLKKIKLFASNVISIAKEGRWTVQALHVGESDEIISAGTPFLFRGTTGWSDGGIVGQDTDGGLIYVQVHSEILPEDCPGWVYIDQGFLLTQLAERLEATPGVPDLFHPLLSDDGSGELIVGDDAEVIGNQLAELETPWTKVLWGPPGAGKTHALASMVEKLLEANPNERTLVIAPSNRATDIALLAIRSKLTSGRGLDALESNRILRYGYARVDELLADERLLGPEILRQLKASIKSLHQQIRQGERDDKDQAYIAVLRARLYQAQLYLKKAIQRHVETCNVVATTTVQSFIQDSPIAGLKWDNVIVDEVTMVPAAFCAYLSSLSTKRFLMVGDPQQLGPVYQQGKSKQEEDFQWMGRDLFDFSGISSAGVGRREIPKDDPRLVRLMCQRRCAVDIWSQVESVYDDIGNAVNEHALSNIKQHAPLEGESVVIVDCNNSESKCEKSGSSWCNIFTADRSVNLAISLFLDSPKHKIAIITPYRAQVKRIIANLKHARTTLRAHGHSANDFPIAAGSIHQFQGSEADIVIFDLVDGPGRSSLGKLLNGEVGTRLVNVAITRARGKLFVIAHSKWCNNQNIQKANRLLHDLIKNGSKVSVNEIFRFFHFADPIQNESGDARK